jgi:Tol biopolymer transport system component
MKHMKPWISLLSLIFATSLSGNSAPSGVASMSSAPTTSSAGNSFNPTFSADGRHLVFVSHANNLVTNDDVGPWLDVFVTDLVTSNTVLVSVSTNGVGGANANANYPSISSNGQFIAFASRASNLASNSYFSDGSFNSFLFLDENNASDIFVRDLNTGVTRPVSVADSGFAPLDPAPSSNLPLSGHPMISANGRWVFFESRATDLVLPAFPSAGMNIYARDTWSNITVLVTADTNGMPVSGKCELGGISPDGRFAVFTTTNKAMVPGVTNMGGDVYLRDLLTSTTIWASSNMAARFNAPYHSRYPLVSADGQFVVFMAGATADEVFRHNTASGATVLISTHAPLGGGGTTSLVSNTGYGLQMTADAGAVAFEADAAAYVWFATSNATHVVTTCPDPSGFGCVNCTEGGTYAIPVARQPSLSADARYAVFLDVCYGVTAYRHDLLTGTAELVLVQTNGGPTGAQFAAHAISPNGAFVAYQSSDPAVSAGDLNGASDIFLRHVDAGVTKLITTAQPAKPAATSFAHSFLGLNSISANGRFIVSTRYDDPSAHRDTNGWSDVFLTDASNGMTVAASINTNLYVTNFDGGNPGPPGTFIDNTNAYSSPVISADGSMIYAVRRIPIGTTRVFGSLTTNAMLGAGMSLVSRGTFSSENGNSYSPSTGSNGLLLVFTSTSSDLVAGFSDNNFLSPDVYLRRMSVLTNGLLDGTNELVSVSTSGTGGDDLSNNGIISPDGRWVIFESQANNLTTNNLNGVAVALFARDLSSNVTHLVGVLPTAANQGAFFPAGAAISGNSRYVAFPSGNSYLTVHDLFTRTSVVAEDPTVATPSLSSNGRFVAFVKKTSGSSLDQIRARDLQASQSDLISASPMGAAGNGKSGSPVISADGRYVVFQSRASDLVPNDTNGMSDVFVRDRTLGVTMLVSANAQGRSGNGPSTLPVMAANGRTVVFQSFASDLVTGDYNDKRDLFVLTLGGADTDGDGMDDDWEVTYFGDKSRNGAGDFDGDGVSDLQEFLAGTDPTNINSYFRVLTIAPAGGGAKLLFWSGNPDRSYRAEFKDDLGAASWTALTGTISWNSSTASITDPGAGGATNRFYRVVRLP